MARFYRVGGTTRLSGLLLGLFTFGLLVVGTGPIAYIRKGCITDRCISR